jgi:hypothetical protein
MERFYNKLEEIVRKYVVKPLVIGGLAGILAYGGKLYGKDMLVNTYIKDWQGRPDIAMNDEGNIVITWESLYQDGSSSGVYAQKFDRELNKIDEEFLVNICTDGYQGLSGVAIDYGSNFEVTWTSGHEGVNKVYAKLYGWGGDVHKEDFLGVCPSNHSKNNFSFLCSSHFRLASGNAF